MIFLFIRFTRPFYLKQYLSLVITVIDNLSVSITHGILEFQVCFITCNKLTIKKYKYMLPVP